MSIWLSVLLFAVGVVLVIKGGDWFVDAASWIAKAARIPAFIIGATIVSFATTMPEMIVSVIASVDGKNDMAVGNAVGSVTVNTGVIMAIAFVFMAVVIQRRRYIWQCLILIASAGVLWLGCLSGNLETWAIIVLTLLFVTFMIISVRDAKMSQEESTPVKTDKKTVTKNIILFIIGAAGIIIGSNLLIEGGSNIATALGVPERVIAVTMVAIGTSLPELVTTITAIAKKETSLSVGNIVGANIIDLALILPICALINGSSFTVSPQSLAIDFPACFIIVVLALVPLLIKQRASKLQGILLLAAYGAYLVITI